MIAYIVSSLRREVQSRLVFRWTLALELVSTATTLGIFFLIDHFHVHLFGERLSSALSALGTSYFGYVSLNLAVATLAAIGLSGVLTQMNNERSLQSFEYIMASPITIQRWAVAAGASNLIRSLVQFCVIFGVAVVALRLKVPRFDAFAAVVVLAVACVPLWSLSLLTLSTSLIFRRGDPLGFLLGTAFELLGGVYAPLDVLPRPLQLCAELLPITPAIRAMQSIVYHGATLSGVASDLMQLVVLSAVYLPVALTLLSTADRVSRRKGYYCLS